MPATCFWTIARALILGLMLTGCGRLKPTDTVGAPAKAPADAHRGVPLLRLDVEAQAWKGIQAHRDKAFAQGNLNTGDHPWEDARFALQGESLWQEGQQSGKAELRLKGDWNDHLMGEQWSFRVKLKKDGRWMGKKEFSIMRPKVRGNLGEYVYHRLLLQEDILHPAYDFAVVQMDETGPWLYAVEEHFRKELVEDRQRREGVLLKFEEDELWAVRRHSEFARLEDLPIEQSARIVPFGASKLTEDPVFAEQFAAASSLLEALHRGDQDLSLLIDRDQWARFLAVIDLTGAYHSLIWHNLRFYADPVRGLLEPVAYDGHTDEGIFNWLTKENIVCNSPWNAPLLRRLTSDEELRRLHRQHLLRLTHPEWLEAFWAKEDSALVLRESWMRYAEPEYRYDRSFLVERAAALREHLMQGVCPADTVQIKFWNDLSERRKRLPLRPSVSLMAWADADSVWVENAHAHPVEVLAFGPGWAYREEVPPTQLKAQNGFGPPARRAFARQTERNARVVYVRELGQDSIYEVPVAAFAAPARHVPREKLTEHVWSADRVWRIRGTVQLDRWLRVPAGGRVVAEPGARLMLASGAGLVVESPAEWLGSASAPIRVEGMPGNHGLLFLDSVAWQHVVASGLEAPARPEWRLTGGITMAGPTSKLEQVTISKAQSEDALNLVRTAYEVLDVSVQNTRSDAVDIDFGQGIVRNLRIEHCGNDALDVSGTVLQLEGLEVLQAGDKALSLGEASRVEARDLHFQSATVGVSIKDASHADIDGLYIEDARIGLVAARKKPRYAMPYARISACRLEGVEQQHLVQEGVRVERNGALLRQEGDVSLEALGY